MNRILPLPSKGLRAMIGSPTDDVLFYQTGQEFFDLCIVKGMTSTSSILDIGCGFGKMAYYLADYLQGNYEGFDVLANLIEWCESVFQQYPNFHFKYIDIANNEFNSNGVVDGSRYIFPYADESFDFVIAKSVFSHLLPEIFDNYLQQISRVTKKGGKVVITLFLRNAESLRLLQTGKGSMPFLYHHGTYATTNPYNHEENICYQEPWVCDRIVEAGLELKEYLYGSWCGRESKNLYEDVYVLEKI